MRPPDPETVAAFRELGFDQTEALLLATAEPAADPTVVQYRLEDCQMTKEQAVRIYS